MKKEIAARSLARTSETIAKVYGGMSFCAWFFHEPKMPEALQRRNAEKESWKK